MSHPGIHPERLAHLLGEAPTLPGSPADKLWRAIVLAPTLPICVALLTGEHVPLNTLDPLWVRRLGLRR